MAFLTPNQFEGFYKISNGGTNQDDKLNVYIDEAEPYYLRDLLGCTLYDLFVADLDPVTGLPVTARFLDIFNAFCIDESLGNGCQRRSNGMVTMLKGFTYYNIVRDSDFFNTISGNVKNTFSNSLDVKELEYGLAERYNVALSTYKTIQWYICENSADYPEYNGIKRDFETWL